MDTTSIDNQVAASPESSADGESPNPHVAANQPRWPAVAAFLLGAAIILGVGFGPGIAHNAAHDTRHTLAFPCH